MFPLSNAMDILIWTSQEVFKNDWLKSILPTVTTKFQLYIDKHEYWTAPYWANCLKAFNKGLFYKYVKISVRKIFQFSKPSTYSFQSWIGYFRRYFSVYSLNVGKYRNFCFPNSLTLRYFWTRVLMWEWDYPRLKISPAVMDW